MQNRIPLPRDRLQQPDLLYSGITGSSPVNASLLGTEKAGSHPGLFRLSLIASFSPIPFIQQFLYGGAVQDWQLFIENVPRYVRIANTVYRASPRSSSSCAFHLEAVPPAAGRIL